MRALSLLNTLQMLYASARTAIEIMPSQKPIRGYGKVHNIAHLVLQRGSYFTSRRPDESLMQWIGQQQTLSTNQLHTKMAKEFEPIYYAEGYRFYQGADDLELCSWCVDKRAFHYAIDGFFDADNDTCHNQFGYIGIVFTSSLLAQIEHEWGDADDIWVLPWLLRDRLKLPARGTAIFDPDATT